MMPAILPRNFTSLHGLLFGGLMGLCVSIMAVGQSVPTSPTLLREITLTQRTNTNLTETTDTTVSGMGVFGNALAIHGHDTLTVQGDLVLHKATVSGQGTLQLRDTQSQRILAHHSTVANLHIKNPTRVILHGELRIRHSLTVKQGTFDTRTAMLQLDDTATVRLPKGGKNLTATTENGIAWAGFPTSEDQRPSPQWATELPFLTLPLTVPVTQTIDFIQLKLPNYHQWITEWSPPPEAGE